MIFIFMIIFNLISLMVVRKHYLMSLIVIEIIFITLMNLFYYYLNFFYFENSLGLVYLIMGVVDSSLGLSLLVYLVRSANLPYISSFTLC
uniref:NADH dehydrogenase subunit 4L n=1 Tax=Nilaparvata bakeri TaxID=1223488 RepID=A0A1L1VG72_9HEMI|nr:NADH dehydrogenase subunit 4L [Nilaparvata bakeri]AGE94104.1 NADH dehydrogenase subunit 4L [Nilaparvata bakeri]